MNRQNVHDEICGAIASCRAEILDALELVLRADSQWSLIRSRILRSFGDRGLSGVSMN
jgi:hypothetical protein